jgi:hypothetical protein
MSQGLAPHSAPSELSRMRSYTAKTAPLTATGAQQRTRLQLEGLAQAERLETSSLEWVS